MLRSLTDGAKVIAAIAVVGIHATSLSESRFAAKHDYLSLDFVSVLVNQWARFSVPLFIYLSGYGLAMSEKVRGIIASYGNTLQRRLPTILMPYAFFSAIALAMEFHSNGGQVPPAQLWNSIARKLLIGGADYHLYFLVILAQCYLLFPLLIYVSRHWTTVFRSVTWASLLLVTALLYKGSSDILLTNIGLSHPGWHASFAIYWLPYFMLGILHAHKPPLRNSIASPETRRWISIAMGTLVIAALALVLVEYIHYSWQATPVDYYNHFSRPSVMLYALAVVWWLHCQSDSRGKFKLTPTVGERLAPLTFTVYLLHPQILRLVNNFLPALPTFFGWLLVVFATFLLAYGMRLLTNKALEKAPGFLAGPLRLLQRCLGLR